MGLGLKLNRERNYMKKYLFGIMFVLSAASMLSACGLKDEVVEKAFNVDMKELNNIAEDSRKLLNCLTVKVRLMLRSKNSPKNIKQKQV